MYIRVSVGNMQAYPAGHTQHGKKNRKGKCKVAGLVVESEELGKDCRNWRIPCVEKGQEVRGEKLSNRAPEAHGGTWTGGLR